MRKYLLFILLLLIIPFSVFAEECNDSKITIKDLTLKKSIGNTEELEEATLTNGQMNLNLKMYEVGDAIEYTFKVKNESSEDYYIDNNYESNHIEYNITSSDNSLKIPVNGEKEFALSVHYNEELEKTDFRAGKFDASSIVNINIIPISIQNPKTGNYFFLILGVLLFISIIMILTQNKKIRVASIILTLFLIPYSSHASCMVNLELNSNIIVGYVVPNPCTYDGNLVQGAEYTNGQYTYRYMQESNYNSGLIWSNIDIDGWGVKLTDPTSTAPVTSIICTSINDKPIVSTSYMFYQSQATSIDTSSFDTSNVTNMSDMFSYSTNIRELDVSNFDTSNVTVMQALLYGCHSLTTVDLSGFDFSNSSSFSSIAGGIFGDTPALKKINLSYAKLPADMSNSIFRNSAANNSPIEEIDVTGWDLSNTTNANGLFGYNGSYGMGGTGLKRIVGLETWDTSNITNMSQLFCGLNCIEQLDLSKFNTANVTDMSNMFCGLYSIEQLDLSSFDTSNVTNMNKMFSDAIKIKQLDLSKFNTANVTDMSNMFSGCSRLTELNISNFDLSNRTSFSSFASGIFERTTSLKKIKMRNMKLPPDMSNSIFRYSGASYSPIEEIDVTNWNLSKTTILSGVFGSDSYNGMGGTGLKRIVGLETWDTSNITDMSNMFYALNSIEQLDLSSFDTSNVTNMTKMFFNLTSIKQLDVSSFNTSNVTNMDAMFYNDFKLQTIKVRDSFTTTSVSGSESMFLGCTSLVGGNGTAYNSSYADKTYARIDAPGTPGYFTRA